MKELILLHGAIGSKDQLSDLKNALSGEYKVHLMNFSGHGGVSFETDFNIPQFALELEKFLANNSIENANIFGYSMGGYVALYMAKKRKSFNGKIMTLGTKFSWSLEITEKETKMLNPVVIEAKIPRFAEILKHRHHPLDWKQVLEKTVNMMMRMGRDNPLRLDDYRSIKVPVKIGLADQDEMVTHEETMEVVRQLPTCEFYTLDNSKHPIERVNIEQLVQEINTFFE